MSRVTRTWSTAHDDPKYGGFIQLAPLVAISFEDEADIEKLEYACGLLKTQMVRARERFAETNVVG